MDNIAFTDMLDTSRWPRGRVRFLNSKNDDKGSGTVLVDGQPVLRFGRRSEAWFAGTMMFWVSYLTSEPKTIGYALVDRAAQEVSDYILRISKG